MDGYRGRDYYTAEEFKDGCSLNYWMGTGAGIVGTVGLGLIVMWVFNII